MSVSLLPPEGPLPPGDLLPHDVQDGGAHEAVLYGAWEQEGGTALQQLVQGLSGFSNRFKVLASELRAMLIRASHLLCVQVDVVDGVVDDHEVLISRDHGVVPPVIGQSVNATIFTTDHSSPSPMCCPAW